MPKSSKGLRIGVEAKIEYNPILDILGDNYESIRRSGLNDMQFHGMSEDQIEKSYQSRFCLQWAWADSIATEVKQTYSQLTTAKKLNIARIKEQIKKKTKKAKSIFKILSKVKIPTAKQRNTALGLKSKIAKIKSLKRELQQLESARRLHICFGSKKLFNAQHHLEENGYLNHSEWLADWKKKRGGRFYCVGKSQHGGGTMIKVFHVSGDDFKAVVTLPRFMQSEHGKQLEIPFVLAECRRRRKSNLLYALRQQKPITVQVFRREHKSNQWYIHLTTYVEEVPITTTRENGCIGVDFNRDSVEWAYVLDDGNIKEKGKINFKWQVEHSLAPVLKDTETDRESFRAPHNAGSRQGFGTGQRQAVMRDLVAKLSSMAFDLQCPIAIESLDFSKKKASMSEASKAYNSMLSNLSTGMFTEALESRCKRYGIGLYKVNPAFTSIIGMIKFMGRYGLNSGTAAAMTIARRAMSMSERAPQCLVRPEDLARHSWTTWNCIAKYLKSNKVRRSQLFNWMKTLEDIVLVDSDISKTDSQGGNARSHRACSTPLPSPASSQSNRINGKSPSPDPKHVQLCLGFE